VEGFVRQILGWREYVRGIYWTRMPGYAELDALQAGEDLPSWYWTGDTDMACLRDALKQTLAHGYAHHIQRLMVTGLYALLLGVQPQQVHAWYLAVYVDAVEWVELPNTLGMSQYADGGLMASKPYVATGKYIQRMSPYCRGCRYDPAQRTARCGLPVHHAVLGLPDAPRDTPGVQLADGAAGEERDASERRRPAGDRRW
jgi:deoxyribodipyrimidine photolyase-related protein